MHALRRTHPNGGAMALCALLMLGTAPRRARAQDFTGVDAQALDPALGGGALNTVSEIPFAARPGISMTAHLAGSPLVYRVPGETPRPVVEELGTADLSAWWGDGQVRAGLGLPVNLLATGSQPGSSTWPTLIGDARLVGNFGLLQAGALELGLRLDGTLPTGNAEAGLGRRMGTVGGGLLMGIVAGPLRLLADLGGRSGAGEALASDVGEGGAFEWAMGGAFSTSPKLDLSLEAQGRVIAGLEAAAMPLEALAGGRLALGEGLYLRAGGGAGLTRGIGAPAYRALLGLSYLPETRAASPRPVAEARQDRKQDPVYGQLVLTARDPAGSAVDAQVLVDGLEEDLRFRARDGSLRVALPPGSYAVALRADGHLPVDKALVVKADGVVHLDLVMPRGSVRVEGDRVVLSERVFFETGSDTIRRESFALLDAVAATLHQHDEIGKVTIRGHTDDVGDEASNLDLSMRRAQAVRNYLVQSGVAWERLDPMGLGENQPLVFGESADARASNRRVEFLITERRPAKAGSEPDPALVPAATADNR